MVPNALSQDSNFPINLSIFPLEIFWKFSSKFTLPYLIISRENDHNFFWKLEFYRERFCNLRVFRRRFSSARRKSTPREKSPPWTRLQFAKNAVWTSEWCLMPSVEIAIFLLIFQLFLSKFLENSLRNLLYRILKFRERMFIIFKKIRIFSGQIWQPASVKRRFPLVRRKSAPREKITTVNRVAIWKVAFSPWLFRSWLRWPVRT